MSTVPDLLRQYGNAVRGDWSNLDGRSVRAVLDGWASLVEEHGAADLPEALVVRERAKTGLCMRGEGHWQIYCGDHGEDE